MDRTVLRLCILFTGYFLWRSDGLSDVYVKDHDGSTVSRLLSGGRGADDASCPAEEPCEDSEVSGVKFTSLTVPCTKLVSSTVECIPPTVLHPPRSTHAHLAPPPAPPTFLATLGDFTY